MPGMSLFNTGKAAVQLNVGAAGGAAHACAIQQQQPCAVPPAAQSCSRTTTSNRCGESSSPEGSTVGWGGNLGDLALSSNGNSLFTCISVTGNAVFLSGRLGPVLPGEHRRAIAINGVKSNVYGSSAVRGALTALIQQTSPQVLENGIQPRHHPRCHG